MGIYLKRRMPKNCKECFLADCEHHKPHRNWEQHRNKNCPMVEVVTPFDDLINRIDVSAAFWEAIKRTDDPYTQVKIIMRYPKTVLKYDNGEY